MLCHRILERRGAVLTFDGDPFGGGREVISFAGEKRGDNDEADFAGSHTDDTGPGKDAGAQNSEAALRDALFVAMACCADQGYATGALLDGLRELKQVMAGHSSELFAQGYLSSREIKPARSIGIAFAAGAYQVKLEDGFSPDKAAETVRTER